MENLLTQVDTHRVVFVVDVSCVGRERQIVKQMRIRGGALPLAVMVRELLALKRDAHPRSFTCSSKAMLEDQGNYPVVSACIIIFILMYPCIYNRQAPRLRL